MTDLTDPGIELKISSADRNVFNHYAERMNTIIMKTKNEVVVDSFRHCVTNV